MNIICADTQLTSKAGDWSSKYIATMAKRSTSQPGDWPSIYLAKMTNK
jgi:hypothetical protein